MVSSRQAKKAEPNEITRVISDTTKAAVGMARRLALRKPPLEHLDTSVSLTVSKLRQR
jgi:hypothetical protein